MNTEPERNQQAQSEFAQPSEPEQLVEHFFRHEFAKLVAVLTRAFGFALVDVVEDMVQESMLEALRCWRQNGVPEKPEAWLHRVARNRIVDTLRRDRKQIHSDDLEITLPDGKIVSMEPDEMQDGMLRMIFACCHPSLERPAQLALTLKLVCGFNDPEVGRGLLISRDAAKKRVTRAKQTLQLNRVGFDLPTMAILNERLDAVHDVLYLMFNEGFNTTSGDAAIDIDLCEEAVRLCHLLCRNDVASTPTTKALLALMLYHASRLQSRLTDEGTIVLLADQDRSLWDRKMMRVAGHWLAKSATGNERSRFHLEAAIARLHCEANSVESTDWKSIVQLYDFLIDMNPSPIYVLNRAVSLGQVKGETEDETRQNRMDALEALNQISHRGTLSKYPLLYCARASLLESLGRTREAIKAWEDAIKLVGTRHERDHITRQIRKLR